MDDIHLGAFVYPYSYHSSRVCARLVYMDDSVVFEYESALHVVNWAVFTHAEEKHFVDL